MHHSRNHAQRKVCYNANMQRETGFIDTHMHLHAVHFDPDRAAVLERATAAGVACMIEIGYDLPSSQAALTLATRHAPIYAVVGIQPNYVHQAPADWLAEVRALAQHPKVVAIGEIGLDYYWNHAPHAQQEAFFLAQLALARELQLPVVIHSRDAQEDTLRVLRAAAHGLNERAGQAGLPGVLHSFSGNWDYARACLDLGFLLSFSGPVTFARAHDLHDVARRMPLERMLTETDSPYLSPHPHRGQRNEPARVRLVAERLACLRDMPLPDLAAAVWANAYTVFGI